VADAFCGSQPHPPLAEPYTDTKGCTYSWQQDVWSAWSSNCSDAATRTKAAYCVQSDGTKVDDSYCKAPKPAAVTETSGQYAGCTAHWAQYTASPGNGTCATGTIDYTSSVQCIDQSGRQISSTTCSANASLKKPAVVQGTASCRAYSTWSGTALGYTGTGYTNDGIMAVSYPGRLSDADALAKAISQCEKYTYQSAHHYTICQYYTSVYYPSVDRTYVYASPPGVYDTRSENPPSNATGAVYFGQSRWQFMNQNMDLYSGDVAFTTKGWSASRRQLDSDYGFYMNYSVK
jgi:hypothetical protein